MSKIGGLKVSSPKFSKVEGSQEFQGLRGLKDQRASRAVSPMSQMSLSQKGLSLHDFKAQDLKLPRGHLALKEFKLSRASKWASMSSNISQTFQG